MNGKMDTKTKLKYEKAKYTVKKWEKEFKTITSTVPTKADIKSAPSKIKEAYRTYYKLKTSVLESTLSDIIIDENAKDCFNSTNDASGSALSKSSESLCEDSVCFQPISETTFSQSLVDSGLQSEALLDTSLFCDQDAKSKPLNFKNVISQNETVDGRSSVEKENAGKNVNSSCGIWGEHLNKSKSYVLPPSQKKLDHKSLSMQYAQKLFNPAKFKNFNKKNPRKPRIFQKSNTFDPLPHKECQALEIPKFEFFGNQEDCGSASIQPICVESTLKDDTALERLNEGIKITTQTSSTSGNVTNLLQKTFESNDDKRVTLFREIDSAWLGRVQSLGDSKKTESMSQDSGVELSQGLSASQPGSDSDSEDLIYDSDSESQTTSRSVATFVKLSNSSTIATNSCQSVIACALPLLNIRKSPLEPRLLPSAPQEFPVRTPNLSDNDSSQKDEFLPEQLFKGSLLTERTAKRALENKISPPCKKPKVDLSSTVETHTGTLPEIVAASKKQVSNRKEASIPEVDKRLIQLEKMLQSGKANENFVAINLEKKVFVRGRKKGTFSKYKKQKWRALKQENGSYSGPRGVLKCFKCGDVGHFSKACTSDKGLLPMEDYISDDESAFSTLEEAAEAAREAGSALHAGKRKFTQPVSLDELSMTHVVEVDRIGTLGSVVKPPYSLDECGNPLGTTPKEVFDCLKNEFGFDHFLEGQESAVMRILSGKSTLVTLSTGSGKSLCYQLPAAIYSQYNPGCITLVVSPLVSLMEDQVVGASGWEKSACYHTFMTQRKRDKVIERLKARELSVLLLSPEALVSLEAGAGKQLLSVLPNIAFACIDEAHCLHQWCHNFRPSYLTVAQVLRERFGVRTLLGLTATASIGAIESLRTHLGIDNSDNDALITDTPLPDNLILSVSVTQQDSEKMEALKSLLSVGYLADCSSIIIYCIRRETCDRVAAFLRSSFQDKGGKNKLGRLSMQAEVYHAGLTAGRRNQVQKSFTSGKLRIVVATVAFGMGINKPNIRGVIHFSLPSTFENYVQEVGRAGRDRMPARCHLFLDSQNADMGELRRHIYGDTTDRFIIRKLLQLIFIPCNCDEGEPCPKHEVAFPIESTVAALDLPQESISTLLAYLELDKRKWIKVLPLAYTKCKISSYKGPNHLKMICKTCPPLALVLSETQEKSKKVVSTLEFDLFELTRKINWDSGVLKNTLKKLEWTTVNDKPQKSGIVVEFLCLGFRVLAPGNLPGEELDYALDVLNNLVQQHEKTKLKGLHAFYEALSKISYDSIDKCNIEEEMTQRSNVLKTEIREYFNGQRTVDNLALPEVTVTNEKAVVDDIRQLIVSSKDDHVLTGRAIARIFHGIGSPNFPPIIWGRTRYWRLHMNQDFNALCKLATQQLLRYR